MNLSKAIIGGSEYTIKDKKAREEIQNLKETTATNENLNKEINERTNSYNTLTENLNKEIDERTNSYNTLTVKVNSLSSGSPLAVGSIEEMIDTTKVYVNTSDGNWYFYNGTSWVVGGVYQSTGIAEGEVKRKNVESDFSEKDLKITIPEFSLIDSSYWGNQTIPNIINYQNFSLSSPIELKKGQTIRVNAYGYLTNLCIINQVDSENNSINGLVYSAGTGQRYYEYTAKQDMYVSISGRTIESQNDILECYIKYDLIDSNYVNDIESLEVVNQSNVLKENDYFIVQNVAHSYNDINYGMNKKELELTINASEVSYSYLFYAFKNFSLGDFTKNDIKNIVACIEIKGKPIDGLYFTIRGDKGKYLTDALKCNLRIPNINEETYTKYYLEVPYTSGVDFTGLCVGVGCSKAQTLNEAKLYIRYIGMKINSNELDLRLNPFTPYDYKETYKFSEVSKELFSAFNTFGVIGDSLASGECVAYENGVAKYIDNYDYSWGQYIAKKYGMKCINFSRGGMTTRSWLNSSEGLIKLQNSDNKCNAYIIGLGVNDSIVLGSDYLGSVSDIDINDHTQNANSFYGNYGKIISNIKLVQPKAKIFMFTIPDIVAGQNQYVEYNAAIREISTLFDNVYLIDLVNYEEYFTTGFIRSNMRSGHYNAIAYKYMSDLLYNWISEYMVSNYSEFKQIEFIGTDYTI